MQPENSRNSVPSPEQLPMPPAMTPEGVPNLPPINTQFERSGGNEHVEQLGEARAQAANAVGAGYVPPVAAMPVTPAVPSPLPVAPSVSATPLVAADEDLIEKEWVDKAKEIIDRTPDDPYARTEKVNELQRDYLQKRYNKVVGADNDEVS